MTQPANRQHKDSLRETATAGDFPDPSDFCDFGYVLADKPEVEKSLPESRTFAR